MGGANLIDFMLVYPFLSMVMIITLFIGVPLMFVYPKEVLRRVFYLWFWVGVGYFILKLVN